MVSILKLKKEISILVSSVALFRENSILFRRKLGVFVTFSLNLLIFFSFLLALDQWRQCRQLLFLKMPIHKF